MKYSDEPCTTCGAPCIGVLCDDHGHVLEAACHEHRHFLATRMLGPGRHVRGSFVLQIEMPAVSEAAAA